MTLASEEVEVIRDTFAIEPELLEHLPPEAQRQMLQVAMIQHSGPLPPPEQLQAYYDIDSRIGDLIVQMAEDFKGQHIEMDRRKTDLIEQQIDRHDDRAKRRDRNGMIALGALVLIVLCSLAVTGFAIVEGIGLGALGACMMGISAIALAVWGGRARKQLPPANDDPPADDP